MQNPPPGKTKGAAPYVTCALRLKSPETRRNLCPTRHGTKVAVQHPFRGDVSPVSPCRRHGSSRRSAALPVNRRSRGPKSTPSAFHFTPAGISTVPGQRLVDTSTSVGNRSTTAGLLGPPFQFSTSL